MFETIRRLTRLYGRIITYPAYTVGAINGHAFAGGAMMALTSTGA
jgi:enoyl-CoA hydratase/carnithine racemase